MIVLDTHAAIWFLTDDTALGRQSRSAADAALMEDRLSVSAITFWEIAMLIKKQRLQTRQSPGEQRARALAAGIRELPVSGDVALLAVELENLHGDPADRFIAATAIVHEATLVTADERLLAWRHKLKRQNATT